MGEGEGEHDQRNQMLGAAGRDHEPDQRPGEEEAAAAEAEAKEAKKPAPGDGDGDVDGAGTEAKACDYCGTAAAAVYCRADSAGLCLPCDRLVHGANGVCSRHARAPLCADCRAAGAVFRRASSSAFLCTNCDFGRHRDGGGDHPPLHHDRCAVQPYSGCPPASELAALLGVPLFDKPAAEDGGAWWNIWEEPQVLSLEDLIVPTTPCHGFEPLLTPSSPKNRSISPDGKLNEEILRQLGELAESDAGVQASAAGREEAEQAGGDQFPSWASPQYATGHGNFGTENNYEVAAMPTPVYENGRWNNCDLDVLNDACKVEVTYDQVPVSSAEPCLSSFAPLSEICPSMSSGHSMEDNHQANPGVGMPMQGLPKRTGFDVVPCPDRDSVISRYKAKRKTRRFDRQVRYESRKVRADGRLRIKGRFAKANQT